MIGRLRLILLAVAAVRVAEGQEEHCARTSAAGSYLFDRRLTWKHHHEEDLCPDDPLKTDPGHCGCGNVDYIGTEDTIKDVCGMECCQGSQACTGWDEGATVTMCAGTCNENLSCKRFADGLKIGLGSCTGAYGCSGALGVRESIGRNSCTAAWSCNNIDKPVGDNSCTAYESCVNCGGRTIGNNACTGRKACKSCAVFNSFEGKIGDDSCLGENSCTRFRDSIETNSCHGLGACNDCDGLVGEKSCNGDLACVSVDGGISSNSCNGENSCRVVRGSSGIGTGSCTSNGSCQTVSGDIGDGSCTEEDSCLDLAGGVGENSCKGNPSCIFSPEALGDFECNADNECVFNEPTPSAAPTKTGTPGVVASGPSPEFSVISCDASSVEVTGTLVNDLSPGELLVYPGDGDVLCAGCAPLLRRITSIADESTSGSKILSTEMASIEEIYGDTLFDLEFSDLTTLLSEAVEDIIGCSHSGGRQLAATVATDHREMQAFPATCNGWRSKYTDGTCVYTDCFVGNFDASMCYSCHTRGCDNGCGAAGGPAFNGNFFVYDFGEACCIHDFCYSSYFSQSTCDANFYADMREECPPPLVSKIIYPIVDNCETNALLFYSAVKKYGAAAEADAKDQQRTYNDSPRCRECDNGSGLPRGGCPDGEKCCDRQCIDESSCCDPATDREVEQGYQGQDPSTYCCSGTFISVDRCCFDDVNCEEGAFCCDDGLSLQSGVCGRCCNDNDCLFGQACCADKLECTVPPSDCTVENAFDNRIGPQAFTRCSVDCTRTPNTLGDPDYPVCLLDTEGLPFCGLRYLCGTICEDSSNCPGNQRCTTNIGCGRPGCMRVP